MKISNHHQSAGLCVLAMLLFAGSDVIAKILSETLHPLSISWLRYTGAALIAVVILAARPRLRHSRHPGLQVVRACGVAGSAVFFIAAVAALPLAEATALVFVSPLLVSLLSVVVLGEVLRPLQWAALVSGLCGVLIVLDPVFGDLSWTAFFPFLSALCWAVGIVLTRRNAASDSAATTFLYSSLVGFLLLSAIVPFRLSVPNRGDLILAVPMSLLWMAAHGCIAIAYRQGSADVSRLAPLSYSQVIWASTLGFIFLGALPQLSTVLGCIVIVASGYFSLRHAPKPGG